jgi:hypothetical protein
MAASPVVQRARQRCRGGTNGPSDSDSPAGGSPAAGRPEAEKAAASPSAHSHPQSFSSPVRQRLAALKSPTAASPGRGSPGKSPAKGSAALRPALGEQAGTAASALSSAGVDRGQPLAPENALLQPYKRLWWPAIWRLGGHDCCMGTCAPDHRPKVFVRSAVICCHCRTAGEMANNKLACAPGDASRAAQGGPVDWRTGLRTASKATKRAWF